MLQKKYSFSGHESFPCKSLWLKKGFDFVVNEYNFNSPEAVIHLGVGKNMVGAIRYWLRSFGLTENDKLTNLACYLFDNETGKDPYSEDLGTLWLLHFLLTSSGEATLYNWVFTRLQIERKSFDRQNLLSFIRRTFIEDGKETLFNENTIKKDIGVFIQNYVLPYKTASNDEYATLLIDLDLITTSDGKNYQFNIDGKRNIPWQIFLFAVISIKGNEKTVSYDLLHKIGLIFCMTDMETIEMCRLLEEKHPNNLRYSDTAGIRQIQFIEDIPAIQALNEYYE